ncbi:hypothetical protein [Ruegeria arenilitoris]|nr:hypothetical protein [Ruegeria arenilitoris]
MVKDWEFERMVEGGLIFARTVHTWMSTFYKISVQSVRVPSEDLSLFLDDGAVRTNDWNGLGADVRQNSVNDCSADKPAAQMYPHFRFEPKLPIFTTVKTSAAQSRGSIRFERHMVCGGDVILNEADVAQVAFF